MEGADPDMLQALSVDESLSDIDRFEKYAVSDIALQRLFQVKGLPDCLPRMELDHVVSRVMPVLPKLVEDNEAAVREALVTAFVPLCQRLTETDESMEVLLDKVVPLLCRLVLDQASAEVRNEAAKSLVTVSQLLSQEHVGSHVLTFVLELAHDADREQHRQIAGGLLGSLSSCLGPELCEMYVVAECESLAGDDVFRVRKTAAANLHLVCATVGESLTLSRLLPVFVRLASDDIWGVRKACAEAIVDVAGTVTESQRAQLLIPVIRGLLQDASRWVRNAAFAALGKFIASLASEDITDDILDHYTAMARQDKSMNAGDAETAYLCAYYFPAVMQRLGASRWDGIRESYLALVGNSRWKVRRSLATSLHVMSTLLGQEIAENDLLPVFDRFLQDIDEVKFAAIQTLGKLMKHVGAEARLQYFETLTSLQQEADNWRFRKALSEQLVDLVPLYDMPSIVQHLLPLAMAVCKDPFAAVRLSAAAALAPMVKRVVEELGDDEVERQLAPVLELATDTSHHHRLVYIGTCGLLVTTLKTELMTKWFLGRFCTLASDPVPNVRLALARDLFGPFSTVESSADSPFLQEIRRRLLEDIDRDVQYTARYLSGESEPDVPKYSGRKWNTRPAPPPADDTSTPDFDPAAPSTTDPEAPTSTANTPKTSLPPVPVQAATAGVAGLSLPSSPQPSKPVPADRPAGPGTPRGRPQLSRNPTPRPDELQERADMHKAISNVSFLKGSPTTVSDASVTATADSNPTPPSNTIPTTDADGDGDDDDAPPAPFLAEKKKVQRQRVGPPRDPNADSSDDSSDDSDDDVAANDDSSDDSDSDNPNARVGMATVPVDDDED